MENLGIRGNMINFAIEFLTNRNFQVKIGQSLSNHKTPQNGIPQGSVISVTLFNIGINKVLENLPHQVQGLLYADDIMIYTTTKTIRNANRKIQIGINSINKWTKERDLKLSENKTSVIVFKRRNRKTDTLPELYLNNTQIKLKEEVKFLGLLLDQKLNFESHIKEMATKAKRSLNILKAVSAKEWGADKTTLLRLYWAVVRSKIEYGSVLYQVGKSSSLKKLDSVHNEALRLCTGAFKSSPIQSIQIEAEDTPLYIRRRELSLRHYTRTISLSHLKNATTTDETLDQLYYETNNAKQPLGVKMRSYINTNMEDLDITEVPEKKLPPWNYDCIQTCTAGVKYSKSANQMLQKYFFLEHLEIHHQGHNIIYTDGSKDPSGVGFSLIHISDQIRGSLPKHTSIFSAELTAINAALKRIEESELINWTIVTDSASSMEAIKNPAIRHPVAIEIQNRILTLTSNGKHIKICKVPSHVGVEGNELADKHAKAAIQTPGMHITGLPIQDAKYYIRTKVYKEWQTVWDINTSKLKEIRPTVDKWKEERGMKRGHQVKLSRLRIGHTKYTHEYLMKKEAPPECDLCHTRLTIKHLLIECQKHKKARKDCRLPSDIRLVLGREPPIENLIKYLEMIGLSKEI